MLVSGSLNFSQGRYRCMNDYISFKGAVIMRKEDPGEVIDRLSAHLDAEEETAV